MLIINNLYYAVLTTKLFLIGNLIKQNYSIYNEAFKT